MLWRQVARSLCLARSMSSKPQATTTTVAAESPPEGLFSGQSLWSRVQSSLTWLPRWRPSSDILLKQAEDRILEAEIKSDYTNHYVPVSKNAVIRTISMEADSTTQTTPTTTTAAAIAPPPHEVGKTPLVMIHGFGAGLLQFYKNLDHLHVDRRLLAFDLPGFGRSSRVSFPRDARGAEEQFVELIEKWRVGMGVNKFILLGHSLGGYLATSYAIRHPEHVRHLVLVDPWGFLDPPPEEELKKRFTGFRRLVWQVMSVMRPFTAVRMAGPWGPDLVKNMRKDLAKVFGEDFLDYVYHCNARNPTGEEGFYHMQYYFAWAQRPMLPRLQTQLDPNVPVTVMCGAKSWLDAINRDRLGKTADLIREARPQQGLYTGVVTFPEARHHLHAEQPEEFNRIVRDVLKSVDAGRDKEGGWWNWDEQHWKRTEQQ